jgi:hypothetical protein
LSRLCRNIGLRTITYGGFAGITSGLAFASSVKTRVPWNDEGLNQRLPLDLICDGLGTDFNGLDQPIAGLD